MRKRMRLEWSILAQADRDAIFDHIESDNPRAAITVDTASVNRLKP
jgi:toxin ParE1/3/4